MVRTGDEGRWRRQEARMELMSWQGQVAMLGGQDKFIGQVETTGGKAGGENRWQGQVVRM